MTRRGLPASQGWAEDSKHRNTLADHAGTGFSSSKITCALSANNKPRKSPISGTTGWKLTPVLRRL